MRLNSPCAKLISPHDLKLDVSRRVSSSPSSHLRDLLCEAFQAGHTSGTDSIPETPCFDRTWPRGTLPS
jgi:hypothetical protein